MNETRELILNEMGKLARLLPEQRMGQIIFNYICANCNNNDPFFIEDTQLLEILEGITQEIEQKRKQRELKKLLDEDPNLIDKIYKMLDKK